MLTFNSLKFNQNKLKTFSLRLRQFCVKGVRKNIFIKTLCGGTIKYSNLFITFLKLHTIGLHSPYN